MFNTLQTQYHQLQKWKNKKVKKFKADQEKKRRERLSVQFSFGEQDEVDLISYSGLMEESSYVQIGDTYARTVYFWLSVCC